MKRMVAVAMVLGLLVGATATAEAAKKKKKKKAPQRIEETVEVTYNGPNLGVSTPAVTGGGCLNGAPAFACLSAIPPFAEAAFVKVEVLDATGQNAGGFISQGDTDGDGIDDGYGQFCGAHPEPIALTTPGAPIDISLYMGICSDASGPSIVTTGTIKATFSNLP